MSDFNPISNSEFMIEKIKERPVNRKKLVKRMLLTASMAVVFGTIACVTLLLLEPVISNWLYPEEESEIEMFPEDEEEMNPEDMLEETPVYEEEILQDPSNNYLNQEQMNEILNAVELSRDHYVQLYDEMWKYAQELKQQMVTVTGIKEENDWLDNRYETTCETSGLIVANNGKDLFILTDEQSILNADKIKVTTNKGKYAEAVLYNKYSAMNMVVLKVSLQSLGYDEESNDISVAVLGSSNTFNIIGSPVIALGSPIGTTDSMGYGMITDKSEKSIYADYNMDILTTDIYGSPDAQGVLFNMKGEVVGIISSNKVDSDMKNAVTAYGITDLRQLIKLLCEGEMVPYLGIRGVSVTKEVNEESKIPYGAYVAEIMEDSPAMLAGLQKGDIIVSINDTSINNYTEYKRNLYNMKSGQSIEIGVMRFSQGIYKEMILKATVAGVN